MPCGRGFATSIPSASFVYPDAASSTNSSDRVFDRFLNQRRILNIALADSSASLPLRYGPRQSFPAQAACLFVISLVADSGSYMLTWWNFTAALYSVGAACVACA